MKIVRVEGSLMCHCCFCRFMSESSWAVMCCCALQAAREASKAAGTRVATGLGTLQARAMENNRVRAARTLLGSAAHCAC